MDIIGRTLFFSLVILFSSWSGTVFSQNDLTASWHGLLLNKPVEIAVWKKPHDPASTWTGFWAYLYSPEHDCLMPGSISYQDEYTSVKFSSYGTGDRIGNCEKNVNHRNTFFRGEGNFDLKSLPDSLVLSIVDLRFPGNPKGEKVKIYLKKGVISKEMLSFVTQYQYDQVTKPHDRQISVLRQMEYVPVAEKQEKNSPNNQERKTVFKSERFWGNFYDFDMPVAVFNGEFNKIDNVQLHRIYYIDMIHTYDEKCQSSLPANKVKRGYVMQDVYLDEFGNEMYRDEPVEVTTYVDPRFVEKYDEYYTASDQFYSKNYMQHVLKHGLLGFDKALKWMPVSQMYKLIDIAGCDSATMYQMKENYRRSMYGLSSLQNSNRVVENANEESDPPNQKSLFQACIEDSKRRYSKMKMYFVDSEKYCTCFDEFSTLYMKPDERDVYSDNFSSYWKDISQLEPSVSKDHAAWRLLKIKNSCTK